VRFAPGRDKFHRSRGEADGDTIDRSAGGVVASTIPMFRSAIVAVKHRRSIETIVFLQSVGTGVTDRSFLCGCWNSAILCQDIVHRIEQVWRHD
jgi:hypothetical protein